MSSEKRKNPEFKSGNRVWIALPDKDNIARGVQKPVECNVIKVYKDYLLVYVIDYAGSMQILKKLAFKDCVSCAFKLIEEQEAEVKKALDTLNYQLEAVREALVKEQEWCVRSREER